VPSRPGLLSWGRKSGHLLEIERREPAEGEKTRPDEREIPFDSCSNMGAMASPRHGGPAPT